MEHTDTIGVALLASGSGLRFGANKLLQILNGKPVAEYVMDIIPNSLRKHSCVITCWPEVAALAVKKGFRVIENSEHEEGISAGIRLATDYFSEADGILFSVCDQPLLKETTISLLCQTWLQNTDCICRVSSGAQAGNPCIFPKAFYPELLHLKGDRGGGVVIRAHSETVLAIEAAPEELWDCDTPEMLSRIEEYLDR